MHGRGAGVGPEQDSGAFVLELEWEEIGRWGGPAQDLLPNTPVPFS